MRQGQSKRMRGRSRGGGGGGGSGGGGGKGPNPLSRTYESNGPDVKIRGNAGTIADKYVQLSRDALSAGDPVAAENYMQHAEHYYRLLAAAQAQFQPHQTFVRADADDFSDVEYDGDGEETGGQQPSAPPQAQGGGGQQNNGYQGRPQNGRPNGAYGEQNRYERRDRQDRQDFRRDGQRDERPRPEGQRAERGESQPRVDPAGEQPSVGDLPAFITGGGAPRPVETPEPASPSAPEPAPAAASPASDDAPEATVAAPQDGDPREAGGAARGRRRRYGRSRAAVGDESGETAESAPAEPSSD